MKLVNFDQDSFTVESDTDSEIKQLYQIVHDYETNQVVWYAGVEGPSAARVKLTEDGSRLKIEKAFPRLETSNLLTFILHIQELHRSNNHDFTSPFTLNMLNMLLAVYCPHDQRDAFQHGKVNDGDDAVMPSKK